jgi:ABC-2 type transport system ATP-binding protein
MSDHEPALRISGLRTRYGNRNILNGLSLRVEPGSIYGLLGPNGAGKTTLIRAICGRVKPIGGTIDVDGIVNTERHALRKIGLVPQDIALYAHLTVRENLEVFGRLSGLSRRQVRVGVDWVSGAAHLENLMHDRIETLSGGWKRRVNIAAAILHNPSLLILDEPTVGVDVEARNGLHDLILELSHSGMGILLTTHDMEQAETLCSKVGFLLGGVLAPEGHPQQLVDETFQDYKEVILELRGSPSYLQFEQLQTAGWAPSNGGLSWSRFEQNRKISETHLAHDFVRQGLNVREVRVREPGLDSLFVHLTRNADREQVEGAA